MAYSCFFGLRGNLDFPDFLQKKFYNINSRIKNTLCIFSLTFSTSFIDKTSTLIAAWLHTTMIHALSYIHVPVDVFRDVTSVTRYKSPNVYKSCPNMISLEKWKILTPLQKLPNNAGDLYQLWMLAQKAKNRQSDHTGCYLCTKNLTRGRSHKHSTKA